MIVAPALVFIAASLRLPSLKLRRKQVALFIVQLFVQLQAALKKMSP
jgi:hypothetical protein